MKHRLTKPQDVAKITEREPSKIRLAAGAAVTAGGAYALQAATDTATILAGCAWVTLGTIYIALNAYDLGYSHKGQDRITRQASRHRPSG